MGIQRFGLHHKVNVVTAIETSSEWREHIKTEAGHYPLGNICISLVPSLGNSYDLFCRLYRPDFFDVVIIDGPKDRLKMFENILIKPELNKVRIIIYDDTDKPENRNLPEKMATKYEKIVFRGFKPQTLHASETTVFYNK